MMRTLFANFAAKSSKFLIETLHLGKGSALPGRLALALDPDLISNFNKNLAQAKYGFFVSGTNGKTTSSGILASIVKAVEGIQPVNNAFGANLYYGIASELVSSSGWDLTLPTKNFVFELDEAAMRLVAKDLKPKTVLLTNIFRDQLDRFGEINATQNLIKEGLREIGLAGTKLILNANDEKIAQLKDLAGEGFDTYFYRVDNVEIAFKESASSLKLETEDIFTASLLERKVDGSLISLSYQAESIEVFLPIAGDFNIYNACGAAAAAYFNGIGFKDIKEGIESYSCAFGRGEKVYYDDKELNVFLIKNPAGCTEVINFVSQFESSEVLIAINDNYADGRDVSWLWDAQFENFLAKDLSFLCSGKRAYDMALRLKYAGIDESRIKVQEELIPAIKDFALKSKKDKNLFVLPTYTALLEINSSF